MDIIISKQQLQKFLIRRFSDKELMKFVRNVKRWIETGEDAEVAIFHEIRNIIASKTFTDINDSGTEEEYWDSYSRYEAPLFAFVKSELGIK